MAPSPSSGHRITGYVLNQSAPTGQYVEYEAGGRLWHQTQPGEQADGKLIEGKIYETPNQRGNETR